MIFLRDGFVAELMKHVAVDSFGNCLKNKEFPPEYVGLQSPEQQDSYDDGSNNPNRSFWFPWS